MANEEIIMSKLDNLGKEIQFIKQHIVDTTLTQDDLNSLDEAEEDLRKGMTKRL